MSVSPFVLARARVAQLVELSPSFVRVELAGPDLAEVGTEHLGFDQRVKVILPGPDGVLPTIADSDSWYDAWLSLPEAERGVMRTYTIREIRGTGEDKRVAIDFVLHLQEGATGPASAWASRAKAGDEILLVAPRLGGDPSGIEWAPGGADHFVLCGDETAVPAISRILLDLPADARGAAFLEVPHGADVLAIEAPSGFEVNWFPREGAPVGTLLTPAALAHLRAVGANASQDTASEPEAAVDAVEAATAEADIWETPTYSGAGLDLPEAAPEHGVPGLYAWIAGESGMVTTLRRHLVRDLGIDRSQVAFMGYWRQAARG